MSETMMIPWYATGFRADDFGKELNEIAETAMHYGATDYVVLRSRDDRYKFQQYVTFDDHEGWERYWEGPDMVEFRAIHSSWYQVPVLYSPWERTTSGRLGGQRSSAYELEEPESEEPTISARPTIDLAPELGERVTAV